MLNIFSMLCHLLILIFIIMISIHLINTSSILLFSKLFIKIFTLKWNHCLEVLDVPSKSQTQSRDLFFFSCFMEYGLCFLKFSVHLSTAWPHFLPLLQPPKWKYLLRLYIFCPLLFVIFLEYLVCFQFSKHHLCEDDSQMSFPGLSLWALDLYF